MYDVIKAKVSGLGQPFEHFCRKVSNFDLTVANSEEFLDMVLEHMKFAGFDSAIKDKAGNLVFVLNGFRTKDNMLLVSHFDAPQGKNTAQPVGSNMVGFKAGLLSGLYCAITLKRSLLPLHGNLIFSCVRRRESFNYGIAHLFENSLKQCAGSIKCAILCEPTDFNICLGHKGRMEYEIIVRSKVDAGLFMQQGVNMLGAMFPLVSELEKVSHTLPSDYTLGASSLKIKDITYGGYMPGSQEKEFKIVVDRAFGPTEDCEGILKRAKLIARNIYNDDSRIAISTAAATDTIKTLSGLEIVSVKESKPWRMESSDPLAVLSLEALKENGFDSRAQYWKNIVTEGSYIFGEKNIPTIGFGAGDESMVGSGEESLTIKEIEKAVYGMSLLVARNMVLPAFGWSNDEI
jgi:acetylornithine deacetylase/succinyl-diaminopimelate desuccinylase-like protein